MRSTINVFFSFNCGECAFVFLSSPLRLVLVLVLLFVASFSTCHVFLYWILFPGIILNKCEQISFLLGSCVFDAVNDASTLHLHLLHSSLSGKTSSWHSTLKRKKILCKRDGSGGRVLSGCPGCYLGNIRVFPYNRDVAIISLLLGMLLAPPVVR